MAPPRSSWWLLSLVLAALAYGGLIYVERTPGRAEGIAGVLLGLYICSQPAANAVDLFFFNRAGLRRTSAGWLALNLLVLLAGWAVMVLGATLLVARAA